MPSLPDASYGPLKVAVSDGGNASESCNLHMIDTENANKLNSEKFSAQYIKYFYLFCELRYIGVKCGLWTQNSEIWFVYIPGLYRGFYPCKLL